ncbi:MAG: hypothetical protein ACTSO9_02550 [Candidatus Helarchaeota archaeon]
MEDKEKVLSRVVGFLYDALDNFKSTMDEVNNSVSTLMNSLTRIEKDLQTLGIQPKHSAPMNAGQLAARIKASSSMSSRERLIGLLTGQPITTTTPTTPVSTPTPSISSAKPVAKPSPPKPIAATPMAGPPKAGPPKAGPPKAGPPKAATPKPMTLPTKATPPIKIATPPTKMKPPTTVMKPPTVPSIKPPPNTGPRPPIMKPPTVAAKPVAAAQVAGGKPGGTSIIGLRDEMLKELKRLKSIMKGG